MSAYYPLFIDGKSWESKSRQEIINPCTGEVFAQVALADKACVEAALDCARNAFDQSPWKDISLAGRKGFLLKVAQGILDRAGELAKLETINTGKPIKESTFMDVPSAAKTFEHFANNLEAYLQEEAVSVLPEVQSRLIRQPQGVVVLIVPWNYPLLIASWKLAQALAAGNSVILKPSSLTPLSALALADIAQEAGIPRGVVNVVNGLGGQIGELLCADKRVDMISFTGSNEVGRQIIGYSAKQAKKLVMELGGKSAAVVLKDADLELAINGSLCSIFLNQGQMCTAMSRILIEDEIYDDFIRGFAAKAKLIKLGDGMDYETQMGPLISDTQRKKVIACVENALKEGAKLLCGGKVPDRPELEKGFFFEPTIFSDVTPNMAIFKEEVFGPVACVSKFSGLNEAVALVNKSDFGLANCIWSKDSARAEELAAKINAGTTWVNTYGMFYNEVPYGGFKQSGFGKELGKEGFLEYTRLKNIIVDQTQGTKPLVNYWYGF